MIKSKFSSSEHKTRSEYKNKHQIRNLRVKVRSLLPSQFCRKQNIRIKRSQNLQKYLNEPINKYIQKQTMNNKNQAITFDKLTLKQIEENKYYFIGNDEAIKKFDKFVQEKHPQVLKSGWNVPILKNKFTLLFDPNIVPKNSLKRANSSINFRVSNSVHHSKFKHQDSNKSIFQSKQISPNKYYSIHISTKQKSQMAKSRKNAVQQQIKWKKDELKMQRYNKNLSACNKRRQIQNVKIRQIKSHNQKLRLFKQSQKIKKYETMYINQMANQLRKKCIKTKKK